MVRSSLEGVGWTWKVSDDLGNVLDGLWKVSDSHRKVSDSLESMLDTGFCLEVLLFTVYCLMSPCSLLVIL